MTKFRKIFYFLCLAILTPAVNVMTKEAYALDRDIGASVNFMPALSLTASDMEFGTIQYADGAGSNDITLSADGGALSCSNTSEYTCPASATPGEIGIAGGVGYSVNIYCDDGGVLSNGTDTLDMQNIELAHGGSVYSCAGMGQAATSYTISGVGGQDSFSIGGKIGIPATGIGDGGSFSTAASGGSAVNVRVVYQ